jgi:hypothetical protein
VADHVRVRLDRVARRHRNRNSNRIYLNRALLKSATKARYYTKQHRPFSEIA